LSQRISGAALLTSWTGFRTALRERDNVRFASAKSERELGVTFRPLEQTFSDAVGWYRHHGQLPQTSAPDRLVMSDSAP
jgi:dihydroflavonol-4-reductase